MKFHKEIPQSKELVISAEKIKERIAHGGLTMDKVEDLLKKEGEGRQ